uniref:Eukaryotic translation initiation factor 2A n=1 Tax=Panagrolaimus sp. JU765 TaxID=591449 RepID=A0AC34Q4P1_9BILA
SAFNPGGDNFLPRVIKQDTFEKNHIARSRQQSSRPRFVVAYQSGVIQLMKNEMDTQPIVIRERNTMIKQCRWSPDGSILAVGAVVGGQSGPTNVLFLMSPWGEKYQALTLPSNNFNCFTWKGDGLMIGCGIDNNLYLATLKPRYKWAYCNQSIVYCYEQADAPEDVAVFYETKMREKHEKHILNIVNVEAFQDLCVLASHTSEIGGPYLLQLCNSIGTPVAQQSITIEPKYISINDGTVVAANNDSFVVWNYIAKAPTNPDVSKSESKQEQENNVW